MAPLRQSARTSASRRISLGGDVRSSDLFQVSHENGQQYEANAQKQTFPDRPARLCRQLRAGENNWHRKFRCCKTRYTRYN